MNVIKLLNSKPKVKKYLYKSSEVYEEGDLVRIVGMKEIVYNNSMPNNLKLGTICKIDKVRDKSIARCQKRYCDLSSSSQCLMIHSIEDGNKNNDRTWTCYAVIERIKE